MRLWSWWGTNSVGVARSTNQAPTSSPADSNSTVPGQRSPRFSSQA